MLFNICKDWFRWIIQKCALVKFQLVFFFLWLWGGKIYIWNLLRHLGIWRVSSNFRLWRQFFILFSFSVWMSVLWKGWYRNLHRWSGGCCLGAVTGVNRSTKYWESCQTFVFFGVCCFTLWLELVQLFYRLHVMVLTSCDGTVQGSSHTFGHLV